MFCQSNDFFYSCHRISKLSYLFNIGLCIWRSKFKSIFKCSSFYTPVSIRHLWQLKTIVFLHWCLIWALLLIKNQENFLKFFKGLLSLNKFTEDEKVDRQFLKITNVELWRLLTVLVFLSCLKNEYFFIKIKSIFL